MDDEKKSGDSITANIGDVSDRSQVAVGKGITQIQEYGPPPTVEDIAQLQQMFEELKAKIDQEVAPADKEKALERVDELKEAVTAKEPDITTMEYVKNWFGKNVPAMASSVMDLIVNPVVGKFVAAGGKALAATFRSRFGL
ncbi:MAG TPA: hypothetical protein VIF64_21410 [Pyrinomonadaceae bacterium]|jgi:hypothetical protein